jgi:hypothetical protein
MRINLRSTLCVAIAIMGIGAAPAMAELAPFGLKSLEISATGAPSAGQAPDTFGRVLGAADVQAGSHPYKLTTSFVLNPPEFLKTVGSSGRFEPAGKGLKDVRVQLPPGFVGNPNATPKCNYHDFIEQKCPNDTVVGVETTVLSESHSGTAGSDAWHRNAVYNLETPGGVPAEFGYFAAGVVPVFLDASVRTGSDYGVSVNVRNIPQVQQVISSTVTIWGVPADPSHDPYRGTCLHSGLEVKGEGEPGEGLWATTPYIEEESEREYEQKEYEEGKIGHTPEAPAGCPAEVPVQPLLTNPTSCGETRVASMSVDDWETPGNFTTEENLFTITAALPPLSGCETLDFSPGLSVTPDGTAGSTPTGLNVGVHVSQESTTNPKGLGEADVKDTTVVLPPGVQVSPSASDGLEACSNAQIGFERYEELDASGRQTPVFKPDIYNPETNKEEATLCPDASKIANVRIKTPLLEGELTGQVYLAAPQNFAGLPENPFSSLIAMYLVAEEPLTGVLVKLPGKVSLNEETGQITTTFENTPQLPFSELKLEFFGTARAPLATPALCGTYNTESSFVPWSGTAAVHPPASFEINSGPELQTASGPERTPCPNPPGDQSLSTLPFAPMLASGTTNNNAGAFSDLTTTLGREDGQQQIQQVTLHYPPGVSGLLSGVALCGEAQANAGTCGPESLIGESVVSVGLGNDPFTVTGGKAYITGPYNGTSTCTVGSPGCAPFGLSIVNPAKAGPFDLQEGRPVVVRAKIEVDPHTAALTVTTNPSGAYAIPHMIEGIPLQIKHVNVNVNRPGFTFNPTSCTPTKVESTIVSAEGAGSTVSTPFQVASCASLKFAPQFKVSTQGKTSKAKGASLTTTIAYPAPFNTYANIAKVKVELPKALPSRLTTLQKACTAAQFNANPAGCPAASVIGHAKAVTPLLPVPLEGPAYFVSNGGEAFPNLIMVLQGYGVKIDLVGDTFISKSGITSSTFKTVPDQPVTSFELRLPEGPYSALAANGNLCKQKLTMPTEFIAQNGAEIHEDTKIDVTGCPPTRAKVAALTRAQKLAKALKTCRKQDKKNKAKRQKCETAARKRYGKVNKKLKKKKK